MRYNIFSALIACSAGLAAPAAGQSCEWEHVVSPVSPNARVTPFDMDASGPDDVWMVGERVVGSFPFWEYHNYAARFDGSAWIETAVPSLDPDGYHNELSGVVAISPDEVYAAGTTKWGGAQELQVFRWDGSEWTLFARNIIGELATVGDLGQAGDDMWLVGHKSNDQPPPATSGVALALRRDGDSWTRYDVPPLAAFGRSRNSLRAFDGVSEDDAWAVGDAKQTFTPGPSFGFSRYLVHWDGTEWTLDDTLPFLELSSLSDVLMLASDDAWAVGYKSGNGNNQPMIAHWDGSAWTEIALDPLPHTGGILRGLAAPAPDEVYALGGYSDENQDTHLLVYRYDGSVWTRMDTAPTGGFGDQFMAATAVPGGGVWGVGIYVRPDSGPLTQRLVCEESGCPADLAVPTGVLDLADVQAFVAGFTGMDTIADLAEPFGVWDLADVGAFVGSFTAGCP